MVLGSSCPVKLANYQPDNNVTEESKIDLDVRDIETAIKGSDLNGAFEIYINGKYSSTQSGFRTLQDFSLDPSMTGESLFETYKLYWGGSASYADAFVQAAFNKTGDFVGLSATAQSELIVKGIQVQVIWMGVIHSLENAVNNCKTNLFSAAGKSVDEAWAYYSGSLEGIIGTSTGKSVFNIAQRRCAQFSKCDADNKAIVNKEILGLFSQIKPLLLGGRCDSGAALIPSIVKYMTIPLIQGTLRYVHRGASNLHWNGTTTGFQKERAEGYAFLAAILPQINKCDSGAAALIRSNMAVNANPYMSDGSQTVASVLQSTYICLGIKCSDIGAAKEDDGFIVFPACVDRALPTSYQRIAEYTPETDVTKQARIDLDIESIDSFSDLGDFTSAGNVYKSGKFSTLSGGGKRNLQSFSLGAATAMSGQTYFEMYKSYWNNASYADAFVDQALTGKGPFQGLGDIARGEAVTKSIQYQVVWMYVLHKLEKAIDDCQASNQTRNDLGVKSVDEAWAYYSGSLEGPQGGSSGFLLYNLAQRRCSQFGTCDKADNKAIVNKEIVAVFAQMQLLLRLGQCSKASLLIKPIATYMTIPLIQGTLRYVHRGATNQFWSGTTTEFQKERAEGYAFLAAALPQINSCNPSVATTLKKNLIANAGTQYLVDGKDKVVSAMQSVYSCLGIRCDQIGKMTEGSEVIIPLCSSFAKAAGSGIAFAAILSFISIFLLF